MLAFKSQMNKASCPRFLALDNHYYSTTAMIVNIPIIIPLRSKARIFTTTAAFQDHQQQYLDHRSSTNSSSCTSNNEPSTWLMHVDQRDRIVPQGPRTYAYARIIGTTRKWWPSTVPVRAAFATSFVRSQVANIDVFTYNDADNDSHDDVHVYNDGHEYADDRDSDWRWIQENDSDNDACWLLKAKWTMLPVCASSPLIIITIAPPPAMIFTTATCSPEIVMKNVAAEMSIGERATLIKRCL